MLDLPLIIVRDVDSLYTSHVFIDLISTKCSTKHYLAQKIQVSSVAKMAQSVRAFVSHAEGGCSNPSRERPKSGGVRSTTKRSATVAIVISRWR